MKTAVRLTGLTSHTLRAWERRYAAVTPGRTTSGRRIYTGTEIERLRRLARLTREGHPISRLVRMDDAELKRWANRTRQPTLDDPTPDSAARTRSTLFSKLQAFDLAALDRGLLRARTTMTPRSFAMELVSPLLKQIGQEVCHLRLSIAQEHASSALLRNHLGELLAPLQLRSNKTSAPLMAFATPEGDLHEFGILLAALLAGTQGFRIRYLGSNLPPDELAQAAQRLSADLVVLGCVDADSPRLVRPLRDYVEAFLESSAQPVAPRLCLGGDCDFALAELQGGERLQHAGSLEEFESLLTWWARPGA